ncbi:Receptor expression-enhancing protein [Aphelenchoides besseyi]|nr:Receptor expression-enhancing protein [Aphelenchoides besseyi]
MSTPLYENLQPRDGFKPPDFKTAKERSVRDEVTSPHQLNSISELRPELMKLLYENKNEVITHTLQHIEQNTGLQREHLAYGLLVTISIYLLVGTHAGFLCGLIGFVYPASATVRAMRSQKLKEDKLWLSYWITFGLLTCVESVAHDRLLHWCPAYWFLKAIFLVALYAPQTRVALKLQKKIIEPTVNKLDQIATFYSQPQAS